ncbi:MAG: type II secretion system protein GspM [Mariprofundaceae bacterium]|nr:type II secretion system protein GspM [Mariprofundaceae bacterium]
MKDTMHKLYLNFNSLNWQQYLEQYWLPYYQGLADREQRLLIFAAISLPAILLIFAIILPLNDARTNQQLALHALQGKVEEAESLAAQLKSKGTAPVRASTMSMVDKIARQVQVRKFMTRLRPQMGRDGGQRLLIQMRSAPYKETIVFFNTLSQQGLSLLQVKLQQSKEQAYVHVQAVIE